MKLIFIKNAEDRNYKNVRFLRKIITAQGKIIPRRLTNLSAKEYRFIRKSM